ncbi:hypothetical protein [Bacillus thuringiensis]|uniref:Uncharacterized protein n=1 Tax=Bacillus thuringiensis TaxID=1428 RepID=A0A9X6VCX8_BACTU|nr:hypothetical protein [Bacillus thuringiensis]MCU5282627.1 hypothetical protein [Bacillus cereus]MEC3270692.1 hypothetical protein [Bacillus thuringiensis]PFB08083.1 hypothetical protein CN398_10210 [Bacillus thuringiensis]
MIKKAELKSPYVLDAKLTDDERELIQYYITCAIQERTKPHRAKYYDGVLTGIVQSLLLLGRKDIFELIEMEFPYHDELN